MKSRRMNHTSGFFYANKGQRGFALFNFAKYY